MILSKSNYCLYRKCSKNAWMKIHRREIYDQLENIPVFKQMLMKGGLEIDPLARKLFPYGVTIEGRGRDAQELTQKHIQQKTAVLFQPEFVFENFSAALDILQYHLETDSYTVYEVKAANEVKDEYLYDVTFQVNVLRMLGMQIDNVYIVHLNREYIRNGDLDYFSLFHKENVTAIVDEMSEEVKADMYNAVNFLSQEDLPGGFCGCVYQGRSNHCVTFSVHNPQIPEYSVHDISRIKRKKLEDLIDSGIYTVDEIPGNLKLSDIQQNQVTANNSNIIIADKTAIAEQLDKLEFPLYFIDYETINPALPRYDGFAPYKHVPFQYSLYVLETPTSEPQLLEFLHTENSDPSREFVESMQKHIGEKGSVVVWHESFEMGRNEDIGKHIPEVYDFILAINKRIFDLKTIFSKQLYIHKDFRGSASIKKVLPVMVPELSYKNLGIQDGGSASEAWNKLTTGNLSAEEKEKIIQDLKKYCGLDAYAMYAIWRELHRFLISQGNKVASDIQ